MKNPDMMIEGRRDDSTKKTKIAIRQIKDMVAENEQVTVKELVNRTGFSRAFFYANEAVHEAMLEAQEQQKRKRMPMPQKEILNKTMEQQLMFLERQNEKLRVQAAILRRENQELKELLREQEESPVQRF